MSDDPPLIRQVSGEDLLGAAKLMNEYFDARAERGEDNVTTLAEFPEVAGMGEDFHSTAHTLATSMAVTNMEIAGAPVEDGEVVEQDLQIPATAMRHLLTGAYMHGMQIGALAGSGVTHPDTD